MVIADPTVILHVRILLVTQVLGCRFELST